MATDPLVGKVLADRFEILERIGEGGTGVVYKAKQLTVDRVVAIKVLGAHVSTDPQWVKRFHNEARAAAKLDHPNTVRVIDFGQTKEGLLFIAMELLHGTSLRDEIDKVGQIEVGRALNIIIQACGSVGEAHSNGIIHRDIKPDNLFLTDLKGADFVKVLDFSVAKLDDPNSQQTRAGIVFGTPSYMSPEQGRGAQLGPGSDIYAFGIVLYEMLNGKPPFDSKIPTEVVMMHLRDKPPALQGVPEPAVRVVMKALSKDPTQRQRTCEELGQECAQALQALGMPIGSPSGPQRIVGAPGTGQQPRVAASGGGGGASAGGGYASSGGGGGQQQQQRGYAGGGGQAGGNPNRTMIADDAGMPVGSRMPNVGSAGGYGAPGGSLPPVAGTPNDRTMAPTAAPMPSGGNAHGTMMLPDSAGVIAFAAQQADEARRRAATSGKAEAAKPAGPLFWTAWVVLGVGIGLAVHFIQIHQALAQATAH